ncbi:transketolase [bacterium SCGC AG-212-C10]|nr:transketolase [bacterium SCGC AG-212-C10]
MQSQPNGDIDQLAINTIRTLSMDAVQAAKSGHPGTPMALAPVGFTLWQEFLRFDPKDPLWPNRDRFVLSAGHASMLLYSLLHLAGVVQADKSDRPTDELAVSLDDIKRFRQLGSRCPGHPEHEHTTGVETTTGPLGQGAANSVGMAIASRWLGARYNRTGYELFDHDVYAVCSDGDLMEGITSEAASLAGHLGLANLCWIYDSNDISIEGNTNLAFGEDVAVRFVAYGWNVEHVDDANDAAALRAALQAFRDTTTGPTLIIVRSHIGYGAPNKQDTAAAHGEALGDDEIVLTKRAYGWPEDAKFFVPDGVRERFDEGIGARGKAARDAWVSLYERYSAAHPDLAAEFETMQRRELPAGWDAYIPTFEPDAKGQATRESGGKVLNAIAARVPWLIGGSADLAPSTKTLLTFEGAGSLQADLPGGQNIHFGIREHAMGAVVNGLTLSRLRAYGSTFLIFSDYERTPIRLSALMGLPSIQAFTHDSIGVGEDGPTHQPIEQLAGLRAIPGLKVLRPCDANEVAEAWRVAMESAHEPTALILSRQAVPTLDRTKYAPASGLRKGAYILAGEPDETPDVILIATGTEVPICVDAYEQLRSEGVRARLVSMPSWELFAAQDASYRDSVLPPSVLARVSVEASATLGWERYTGFAGTNIGMTTFGASAPLKDLLSHFGFTVDHIVSAAKALLPRP